MIKNLIIMPSRRANGFKDLLGRTFGRLTVIEYMGSEQVSTAPLKYKSVWKVQCTCGNKKVVRGASLGQRTRSCGCLSSEQTVAFNIRTKTKAAYDTFGSLLRSYRQGARKRGLEFNLTRDEFYNLTQQNCYYCGRPPSQKRAARVKTKLAPFTYNGVDRVNSDVGYELHNCVPCCKRCNRMKVDIPQLEFYAHIKQIIAHLGL